MAIVRQEVYITYITEHENGDIIKTTVNDDTGEFVEHRRVIKYGSS